MISSNYQIQTLLHAIGMAKIKVSPIECGYIVSIVIPTEGLSDLDIAILANHLPGEREDAIIRNRIRDNLDENIIFEDASDAYRTAEHQAKSMDKKLLFSIYRETGIVFSLPPKNAMVFHPRIKK